MKDCQQVDVCGEGGGLLEFGFGFAHPNVGRGAAARCDEQEETPTADCERLRGLPFKCLPNPGTLARVLRLPESHPTPLV
ncbi:hypothetical protein EYF80_017309 [Liparis tanakae]|uniref:Uncharacterized protein n=1 Tax=Liparis tanakae TaxID=230148 RepID=A0A4Z2I5M6_9TELE|nr:hypothetical protein EYF80_017309 [Liparis tanakae]